MSRASQLVLSTRCVKAKLHYFDLLQIVVQLVKIGNCLVDKKPHDLLSCISANYA